MLIMVCVQFEAYSFKVVASEVAFFQALPEFHLNTLRFGIAPHVFGSTIIQIVMSDRDSLPWHGEGVSAKHLAPALCCDVPACAILGMSL